MSAAFQKEGSAKSDMVNTQELYAQIGQLKVENESLKKGVPNWEYRSAGTIGQYPV